ncbi:MAG: hypothetical protein ACRD4O_06510 [Bryobacteraceae bacterium]
MRKPINYQSLLWSESKTTPGVRYAIRRISLGQRLELTRRARELSLEHDFLKAGSIGEQMEASLSDLLVERLYLEWGLAEIDGLKVDGEAATPTTLIEKGPELLAREALASIQAELGLSDDERKNS